MKAYKVIVHGRVQRVGYRRYLLDIAQELEVAGWVRNNPDGSVSVLVQGADLAVGRFLEAARNPPSPMRISSFEASEDKPRSSVRYFRIKYGHIGEELQEGFGAMQTAFHEYWGEFRSFKDEFVDLRREIKELRNEFRSFKEDLRDALSNTAENLRTILERETVVDEKLTDIAERLMKRSG